MNTNHDYQNAVLVFLAVIVAVGLVAVLVSGCEGVELSEVPTEYLTYFPTATETASATATVTANFALTDTPSPSATVAPADTPTQTATPSPSIIEVTPLGGEWGVLRPHPPKFDENGLYHEAMAVNFQPYWVLNVRRCKEDYFDPPTNGRHPDKDCTRIDQISGDDVVIAYFKLALKLESDATWSEWLCIDPVGSYHCDRVVIYRDGSGQVHGAMFE